MINIGIEITNTEFKIGIVKCDGRAQLLDSAKIPFIWDFDEAMKSVFECAESLLKNASVCTCEIETVGFAIEGDVIGTVAYGSIFGDKADFSEILKYLPAKKVSLTKRENAMALAEQYVTYGDMYSIAYITLNEKIGFGLVIGGKPYVGGNGLAAEIAHTTVQRGGKECSCKNNGCFEAYCSLSEYLNENTDHDEYVSYLACGITNVMNLFQPNVIVLGGEVARLGGASLLNEINAIIQKENYARNSVSKSHVSFPTVCSCRSAVIGAALA